MGARRVNFGRVTLGTEERRWLGALNEAIPNLCRRMPESLKDTSMLAIQRHFAGFRLVHTGNFYTKFYAPAWTPLLYLGNHSRPIPMEHHLRAQAMAMFLHMFDDHLTDGEIPVDNLMLHLRSMAWMLFEESRAVFERSDPEGKEFSDGLIDLYFRSVHEPGEPEDLAAYEKVFRGQMSTGLVSVLSAARSTRAPVDEVRRMYESFCVAWRLLDDMRDVEVDWGRGTRSAVYHALAPETQEVWGKVPLDGAVTAGAEEELRVRICDLVDEAARIARSLDLYSLTQQYAELVMPLRHPWKEEQR